MNLLTLIKKGNLTIIGVHDAISAIVSQRFGAKALWVSSLGLSTVSGVPDSNILTWSESLQMVKHIRDATTIPILVDADTGYGDVAIFQRVVKEYERIGVNGLCIEDKIFPKRNSFLSRKGSAMCMPIDMCAKIRVAVKTRKSKNFIIVARIESFIEGVGLDDAKNRADLYKKAGADVIVIHSKKETPDEIYSFTKKWHKLPIICIPTTYHKEPKKDLFKHNVNAVILANQILRSYIESIKGTMGGLNDDYIRTNLMEDAMTTVKEIFSLTKTDKLLTLEKDSYGKSV